MPASAILDISHYCSLHLTSSSELHNLRLLDMSMNNITALPDFLFEMTQLVSLFLGSNKIREISPAISQLRKLEVLDLDHNHVSLLFFFFWFTYLLSFFVSLPFYLSPVCAA
jgi:hypothetical protein